MKSLTRQEKQLLYRKHEGMCALCGEHVDFGEMNIDHIAPLATGGADTLQNMQVAHKFCNVSKGKRDAPLRCLPARRPIYTDKKTDVALYLKERDLGVKCDLRPLDIMIPAAVKEVLDVYCSEQAQSKTQVLCKFIESLEHLLSEQGAAELARIRRWRERRL